MLRQYPVSCYSKRHFRSVVTDDSICGMFNTNKCQNIAQMQNIRVREYSNAFK